LVNGATPYHFTTQPIYQSTNLLIYQTPINRIINREETFHV